MKVRDIQDSIEIIKSKPKPLAIYAFTKDENLKTRILSETSSGSVTFNDVMIQVTLGLDNDSLCGLNEWSILILSLNFGQSQYINFLIWFVLNGIAVYV